MTHPNVPTKVLIFGASYGLLPAVKLSLSGCSVTLLAYPKTLHTLQERGVQLMLPAKEETRPLVLHVPARHGPARTSGELGLVQSKEVNVADFDLIILAMQEPHFRAPDIAALMSRISEAKHPCLSLMNIPPLTYFSNIKGIAYNNLLMAYSAPEVWLRLDPSCLSVASPDPQAVRPDANEPGSVEVTLGTNFRMTNFAQPHHAKILQDVTERMDNLQHELDGKRVRSQVRFVLHNSIFTPLTKWPMLITGNCRSLRDGKPVSIKDAVLSDIEESRDIFNWVRSVVLSLGATEMEMISFERYLEVVPSLTVPSLLARSLYAGVSYVERIDLLVQLIAQTKGESHPLLESIVLRIEDRIGKNRRALQEKFQTSAA